MPTIIPPDEPILILRHGLDPRVPGTVAPWDRASPEASEPDSYTITSGGSIIFTNTYFTP